MQTASDTEYFSLAPLGFDGWEHTIALKAENGRRSLFVRPVGCRLPHLIVTGGSMFDAVVGFIEGQERFGRFAGLRN